MSRDQEGRIYTARTATLQKIMKFRMESQQKHDELMLKRMRQRSSMKNQNLEPKPPDSISTDQASIRGLKKKMQIVESNISSHQPTHMEQTTSIFSHS